MPNPKIILNLNSRKKSGLFPVQLQVYIKRKRVAITLPGLELSPQDFDEAAGKVLRSHPDHQDINLEIGLALARANKILREHRLRDDLIPLTSKAFKQEFKAFASREDLLEFWEKRLSLEYERRVISKATLIMQTRSLNKLKEFTGGRLLFAELSRDLLERFDHWHLKRLEASGYKGAREREKSLKHLRKFLKMAEAEGIKFKNPFQGFKWPKYQSSPEFLTEQELRALLSLWREPLEIELRMSQAGRERGLSWHHLEQYASPSGVERIRKILRLFLFQCFSGIRFSDLQGLRGKNLQGDHLIFTPQKTQESSGAQVRMRLSPILEELLEESPRGREAQLLPAISNQKYNLYLKELSELSGIEKSITTHTGRHTFGTISLSRGMSLEILQSLMGLRNIKTLLVYVHITEQRKDEELLRAWGGF